MMILRSVTSSFLFYLLADMFYGFVLVWLLVWFWPAVDTITVYGTLLMLVNERACFDLRCDRI